MQMPVSYFISSSNTLPVNTSQYFLLFFAPQTISLILFHAAVVVLDESHASLKKEKACEVFRLLERIALENKVTCDGQAVNASRLVYTPCLVLSIWQCDILATYPLALCLYRVVFILTSNEGMEHLASTKAKRRETSGAWKQQHLREAILEEWEGKNVMSECNLSISLEKLVS